MDFQDFIKSAKIEFISNLSFGHHPMQLIAINNEGKCELNALAHLHLNDIRDRFENYLSNEKHKEIYISLDFPSNTEIFNDFVLLMHFKGKKLIQSIIKEYSSKNGEELKESKGEQYDVVVKISKLLTGEDKWENGLPLCHCFSSS